MIIFENYYVFLLYRMDDDNISINWFLRPELHQKKSVIKDKFTEKLYLIDHNGSIRSWIHDIPALPLTLKDSQELNQGTKEQRRQEAKRKALEQFDKDHIVNMVIEIPRGTNKKMEMSVSEFYNPITQDRKKGILRRVPAPTHDESEDLFYKLKIRKGDRTHGIKTYGDIYGKPFKGYNLFHYGAIPQTFEDKKNPNQFQFIDGNGNLASDTYIDYKSS